MSINPVIEFNALNADHQKAYMKAVEEWDADHDVAMQLARKPITIYKAACVLEDTVGIAIELERADNGALVFLLADDEDGAVTVVDGVYGNPTPRLSWDKVREMKIEEGCRSFLVLLQSAIEFADLLWQESEHR